MTDEWIGSVRRVYLDANILIYFIEGHEVYQAKIEALFKALLSRNVQLVINEVVVVECLYGAYRLTRTDLEESYRHFFFESGAFEIVPVDFAVLDKAARIGAAKGLKLLDATHYCSAIDADCAVLLTNDRVFRSSPELTVVRLSGAL